MNDLLIFFALPIATIILAAVLEKVINSSFAVTATFFAIYLVVTFAAFDESFLVFAIVYTILAFISAVITRLLIDLFCKRCCPEQRDRNGNLINLLNSTNNNNILGVNDVAVVRQKDIVADNIRCNTLRCVDSRCDSSSCDTSRCNTSNCNNLNTNNINGIRVHSCACRR